MDKFYNEEASWPTVIPMPPIIADKHLLQPPDLLAAPLVVLADCAHHIAEACVQCFPFNAGSMASQVGASAWFVSTVL